MYVVLANLGQDELPWNQKCSHVASSNRCKHEHAGDAYASATLSDLPTGVWCTAWITLWRTTAPGNFCCAAIHKIGTEQLENLRWASVLQISSWVLRDCQRILRIVRWKWVSLTKFTIRFFNIASLYSQSEPKSLERGTGRRTATVIYGKSRITANWSGCHWLALG